MNTTYKYLFIFWFCSFVSFACTGQYFPGQILLNGNASWIGTQSITDREVSANSINGEFIPAYKYEQIQDYFNFTLAPKAHYFFSEKWSAGLGFGFRKIVSDRYIPSVILEETTDFVSFSVVTKNKSTTLSYAPQVEIARYWMIGEKLSVNLTGYMSWQLLTLRQEESDFLSFTPVSELTNWTMSDDGLRYSPTNKELETTNNEDQFWYLGIYPQLRYFFTPRFGMTAIIGGVSVSQEYKSTQADFIKAKPVLSVGINSSTWTFGLYYIFGSSD